MRYPVSVVHRASKEQSLMNFSIALFSIQAPVILSIDDTDNTWISKKHLQVVMCLPLREWDEEHTCMGGGGVHGWRRRADSLCTMAVNALNG